ncbi:Rft protein-domain-containing protein [Aspergillus pseudoustus]|uniref:Man(5)GlcNAc(2)-PP-dolichol translocation protein RFT1 n=1 Tax=Aspergillus pseudoustus TaxID=1810923 RepID=A0ABR4JW63_9EURO
MSQEAGKASNMLASAMSGTTSLIFIQLASRLFIFSSNQLILRSLSPSILGVAAQLELFMITIIYFSRESIRAAIQRQPLLPPTTSPADTDQDAKSPIEEQRLQRAQAKSSQSVVNMSYLCIIMGVVMAAAFGTFYVQFASEEVLETPLYHRSVAVTAFAALIELSSEPFFSVAQQHMLYQKRAAVEICAAFMKSLVTCGVSIWGFWTSHSLGVLPFALGYLTYSTVIVCGYFLATKQLSRVWHFSFLLSRIESSTKSEYLLDRFPRLLLSLSANVFFQAVVKHLLTQGDSLILAAMTSLQDQGIYSLASNYGGLLARILFQPIEESSRTIFSALLSSTGAKGRDGNIRTARAHLLNVLRGYMVISVLVIPLGPSLTPRALYILGGRRWAVPEIDSLLASYCYYIPFLAFNGISEAFVSSAASPSQLRKQAAWMGLFSACFALAAYLLLAIGGMGARGLVYANIVNMFVRIVWSMRFIRRYLCQHNSDITFNEFALRPQTYAAGAAAMALFSAAEAKLPSYGNILPFGLGGGYVLLMLYSEREHIMTHYTKLQRVIKSRTTRSKTD